MTTQERNRQGFWQSLFGRDGGKEPREEIPEPVVEASSQEPGPEVEIAPNDPIVAYFASASGVVEIDKLDLDSPAPARRLLDDEPFHRREAFRGGEHLERAHVVAARALDQHR